MGWFSRERTARIMRYQSCQGFRIPCLRPILQLWSLWSLPSRCSDWRNGGPISSLRTLLLNLESLVVGLRSFRKRFLCPSQKVAQAAVCQFLASCYFCLCFLLLFLTPRRLSYRVSLSHYRRFAQSLHASQSFLNLGCCWRKWCVAMRIEVAQGGPWPMPANLEVSWHLHASFVS